MAVNTHNYFDENAETGWESHGMDWENPDPSDSRYMAALFFAVAEREEIGTTYELALADNRYKTISISSDGHVTSVAVKENSDAYINDHWDRTVFRVWGADYPHKYTHDWRQRVDATDYSNGGKVDKTKEYPLAVPVFAGRLFDYNCFIDLRTRILEMIKRFVDVENSKRSIHDKRDMTPEEYERSSGWGNLPTTGNRKQTDGFYRMFDLPDGEFRGHFPYAYSMREIDYESAVKFLALPPRGSVSSAFAPWMKYAKEILDKLTVFNSVQHFTSGILGYGESKKKHENIDDAIAEAFANIERVNIGQNMNSDKLFTNPEAVAKINTLGEEWEEEEMFGNLGYGAFLKLTATRENVFEERTTGQGAFERPVESDDDDGKTYMLAEVHWEEIYKVMDQTYDLLGFVPDGYFAAVRGYPFGWEKNYDHTEEYVERNTNGQGVRIDRYVAKASTSIYSGCGGPGAAVSITGLGQMQPYEPKDVTLCFVPPEKGNIPPGQIYQIIPPFVDSAGQTVYTHVGRTYSVSIGTQSYYYAVLLDYNNCFVCSKKSPQR